jgi:ribonuclease HI
MLAIYYAIKYTKSSGLPCFNIIFTDSLISVKCLNNHRNNNSLKSKIIEAVNTYKNEITIFWIPGHSNNEGNERVDCLLKEAANNEQI